MIFDVIIIGSGPGGGMVACRLATSGLRVLLLEKERLPRHKPCGGGLTISVLKLFDWDIEPFIERRVGQVRRLYNYERPHVVEPESPILMVNRPDFDNHLVQRALALGKGNVELREGFRVTEVHEDADSVRIRGANGEVLDARFLIAADGAFSPTARHLNLDRAGNAQGAAVDAEVTVDAETFARECGRATFNYFCVPHGYGWIFPKRDVLSCGVGVWQGKTPLPPALDEFLERSLPAGSIQSVQRSGHAIPLHMGRREVATPRVCLVGDAASLVDPIMGEGIRFALESGSLAAEVVSGLLGAETSPVSGRDIPRWGEADCLRYQQIIDSTMGQHFTALQQIAGRIFLDAPEHFYEQFVVKGGNYSRLSETLVQQMKARPRHTASS